MENVELYLKLDGNTIENGNTLNDQIMIALKIITLNAISENDIRQALVLIDKVRLNGIDKLDDYTINSIIRILYSSLYLTTAKTRLTALCFSENREKLVDLINWKKEMMITINNSI
jgi:hypothetical protein